MGRVRISLSRVNQSNDLTMRIVDVCSVLRTETGPVRHLPADNVNVKDRRELNPYLLPEALGFVHGTKAISHGAKQATEL